MIRCILYAIVFFNSLSCFSQNKSRFSLQVNYGLTGNFFVRNYDEAYSPSYTHKYFYSKNFIGTVAGIYADYRVSRRSFVFVEYSRSTNMGRKNYFKDANGTEVYIRDFRIRHINNFYHLGYGLNIKMKNFVLRPDIGVMEIYDSKQTITIEDLNSIRIDESNFKNDNSVEGGVFLGLGCTKKIDTKFDIGIKARVYYLISTSSLEAVTLTPTLTYHFLKKQKS